MPIWIDHTGLETTVDQARIEVALETLPRAARRRSFTSGSGTRASPALRAAGAARRRAHGLRAGEAARRRARIANYAVHLVSKYSREFLLEIEHRYDYIVDNNLASYACCKYHFHRMLDNYVWCLRPDGRV